MTVHYTASPCRSGKDAVREIASYQVGPTAQEEFPGIAYTLVVDCAGTVYQCWDLSIRCWHSGAVINGISRNQSHVGICIINDNAPFYAQISGLASAIWWVEDQIGKHLPLEGHQDAPYPTPCPGIQWGSWKGTLLSML